MRCLYCGNVLVVTGSDVNGNATYDDFCGEYCFSKYTMEFCDDCGNSGAKLVRIEETEDRFLCESCKEARN